MNTHEDFAGKSALVVGGSSGIGAAVAKLLLQRGAATVLIVGKNPDKLKTAETELRFRSEDSAPKPRTLLIQHNFSNCCRPSATSTQLWTCW